MGENKLGSLISKLMDLNISDDIKRCLDNEDYRKKLYEEFGIM